MADATRVGTAFVFGYVGGGEIPFLMRDDAFDLSGERAAVAYGMSWALVHYLLSERPEAFFIYLRRIAKGGAGEATDRVALFQEVFAKDLGTFEQAWHAYMRRFDQV